MASALTELRHQVEGVTAIYPREIFRIELAACQTLDMVGSGSEWKIGAKEDLLRRYEVRQGLHGHRVRRLRGIAIEIAVSSEHLPAPCLE